MGRTGSQENREDNRPQRREAGTLPGYSSQVWEGGGSSCRARLTVMGGDDPHLRGLYPEDTSPSSPHAVSSQLMCSLMKMPRDYMALPPAQGFSGMLSAICTPFRPQSCGGREVAQALAEGRKGCSPMQRWLERSKVEPCGSGPVPSYPLQNCCPTGPAGPAGRCAPGQEAGDSCRHTAVPRPGAALWLPEAPLAHPACWLFFLSHFPIPLVQVFPSHPEFNF